ncbi:Prefoldin [Blastocladiella britannica]|nr:Prefoldin [Blastocladiella britannica]
MAPPKSGASSASASTEPRPSDSDIANRFSSMRQELQSLLTKLSELEADKEEHMQVIETMKPLDGDRKAYRLVGGVLMERTVKEVLPALVANMEGIMEVMKQIATTYKKKEDEMKLFQQKYDIRIVQTGPDGRPLNQ